MVMVYEGKLPWFGFTSRLFYTKTNKRRSLLWLVIQVQAGKFPSFRNFTFWTGKELERRPYAPGQHGPTQRKKISEYGLQQAEKQKLRHMYGLTERQFKTRSTKLVNYKVNMVRTLWSLLEQRLDNIVYRLGLARTRRAARQLVNHGHITVDGKRVDIPSYQVSVGQVISVREKSAKTLQSLKA